MSTFLGACIATIAAFVNAGQSVAFPGAAAIIVATAVSVRRGRFRPELALRLCLGIAAGFLLVRAS